MIAHRGGKLLIRGLGALWMNRRVRHYAQRPDRLKELAEDARHKARQQPEDGRMSEILSPLKSMLRMLRAYATGRYPHVPWQTLLRATAAALYFVSPLDLIPDWIPVAGFLDDAAVIAWVLRSIREDLDEFEQWEQQEPGTPAGPAPKAPQAQP